MTSNSFFEKWIFTLHMMFMSSEKQEQFKLHVYKIQPEYWRHLHCANFIKLSKNEDETTESLHKSFEDYEVWLSATIITMKQTAYLQYESNQP